MKMIKRIRNILIVLAVLILYLIFLSEKWFLETWDSSIAFSTIVYQIFSPLKGAESQKTIFRNW